MPVRAQSGFVLVAALWVLAALVVLAAYIDAVATAEVRRATLAKQSLERDLARRSLENTLLYLLATNRMNHRALVLEEQQRFAGGLPEGALFDVEGDGELLLTGATYAAANGLRFAIQDESGLVSVNRPRSPLFAAILEQAGLPRPAVVATVARVADYIDLDHRLTLNGAEAFDYQWRDLPPPPNWQMVSPLELKRVLGVETLVADEQWRRLRPLLTARVPAGYNLNTMQPQVLSGLFDFDAAALEPLLEARAQKALVGPDQVARLTGRPLAINPTQLITLPSNFLRISIWHASEEANGQDDSMRHVLGVEITPYGQEVPWQKDYRYQEPSAEGVGLSPRMGALSGGSARGLAPSQERALSGGSASGLAPSQERASAGGARRPLATDRRASGLAPRTGDSSAGAARNRTARERTPSTRASADDASPRQGPLVPATRLLQ